MITDWSQLVVPRAWYDDKPKRKWSVRRDRWAAADKRAICIVAEMISPLIPSEPDGSVHLDAVLSYGALTTHPTETLLPPGRPAIIPIPVSLAWISPDGLPLWACTPLRPASESAQSREYWHKRHPMDRAEFAARPNVNTRAGRWKEYRTPVNGVMVNRMMAHAIGNTDEIRALLDCVTHIGKKTAAGYGRVGRWHVTYAPDVDEDAVLARRAVPVSYYAGRTPRGILCPCRAWTPPYWYAPWWADCMIDEEKQ